MGVFDNLLKDDESLFRNPTALDYDFIPKKMQFREGEHEAIASCIFPLLKERNGRNIIITGAPGIGKTLACMKLQQELEEQTDDVFFIYVNCWKHNTTFKIVLEICEELGYRLTHNKKTEELFKVITGLINKKAAVFVFDEVDKVEDFNFLYTLIEDIYRKAIIMISNEREWLISLDQRIKSRLTAEMLEFRPYGLREVSGILRDRIELTFVPGVWDEEASELVFAKCFELSDIRKGLHLLKEAGQCAENRSSRKVLPEHVKVAADKLDEFSVKDKEELEDDSRLILGLVRENSGLRIGELFKLYQKNGGGGQYKTFQRRIKKLADGKFISAEKITGGSEGTTTIIKHASEKKLTDF